MKKIILTIAILVSIQPGFSFPERNLKIYVYTKPGGAIDVFIRKFQSIAKQFVDKEILVVNKPGAGGIISLKHLKRKPDGHTVMAVTKSNIGKIAGLRKGLKVDDFHWITTFVTDPESIIVNSAGDIRDWKTFIEAKDKELLWCGPAIGGNDHIMAMKIWKTLGIKGKWIPYSGGGKAVAALMGKHCDLYVGNPGDVIGKEGVINIAIAAPERMKDKFSHIATFKELGVTELDNEIMWRGLAGPKKMTAKQEAFWADLVKKVSETDEWKAFQKKKGSKIYLVQGDEFDHLVSNEFKEFKEIILELRKNK
ncbi:MAG: tripartite tricarboxylate transporter substrate binding protein [Oligoflexia bacterium]|nr:tripartite tricarboxylate transporter substrate binding protein [Oligoflexia bacterium]